MSGAHILVADPDPQSRAVLTWLLRECGHAVDAYDAPEEMRAAACEREPDLVVLGFDDSEGQRLLDGLEADPRLADVPVIAAIDRDHAPDDVGLGRGVTDVVERPILVRQFLARVDAQLRLRTALRDARARSAVLELELQRVRDDAAATNEVMEIVHEIVGEGSTTAIYRVLARRLARALGISRCSVILASPGDSMAMVAVAHDDVALQDFAIRLEDYPEVSDALESGRPVLVEDAGSDPRLLAVARMRHGVAQLRSAVVLPFTLDRWRTGVLFLRTRQGERALTQEDLEFAEPVLRAAVGAVRRSHVLESTRADNQRLEALATTDPLTRLLNRRALHERLAAEVQRADRYGAILTLMMIDIDHFKQVNDTHGHLIGDAVLAQLAGILQGSLRTVDIAARYGGEEFMAILPETPLDSGVVIAERVRERMEEHDFQGLHGLPLQLTVSIGIAAYPSTGVHSTDDLIARADAALYRAKADGRNVVRA